MLRSNLSDSTDVYIVVKRRIAVESTDDFDKRTKNLMFKNLT